MVNKRKWIDLNPIGGIIPTGQEIGEVWLMYNPLMQI
jgi:hypothetical protein